jgi:anti-sigma B factor antagonist
MTGFEVDVRMLRDSCDMVVCGEIDTQVADDLAAMGQLCLIEPGVRSLALDLSAVTFIDSTGLGAMVRIRNIALEFDKPLTLRNPSQRVVRLLQLAALDRVFQLEPVRAQAM